VPEQTPPPAAVQPPITRANTVVEFLKAHGRDDQGGELRIGPGAGDLFLDLVNQLAFQVTRKAADLCRADAGRTTLLEKDIRTAYDALVWIQGSGATASPDLLFSHIDRLPTDQLAELVRRINDWLGSQGRPR
jgi:histone H3/H4